MADPDDLKRHWAAVKAAPFQFLAIAITCGGLGFGAGTFYYSRQVDILEHQLTAKESELAGLTSGASSVSAIKATNPKYISDMSNSDLKLAAYTLAGRIDEFIEPFRKELSQAEDDEALSIGDKAKKRVDVLARMDERFRAELALDAVNLIEELAKRTDIGTYVIEDLSTKMADRTTISGISVILEMGANQLR